MLLACVGCSTGPADTRTMHAGALTVSVPPHWAQAYGGSDTGRVRLGLTRSTFKFFGTPASVDLKDSPYLQGVWTPEAAARWQDDYVKFLQSQENGGSAIATQEGKPPYPALCVKSAVSARKVKLHCVILGTPQQFDFLGGADFLGEARQMLESLH